MDLPTNPTILKILKMLKSIKNKSAAPSPIKELDIPSEPKQTPLDSPYPVTDKQFTYDSPDAPNLFLSQPIPNCKPEAQYNAAHLDSDKASGKRVTLNKFLGSENRRPVKTGLLTGKKEHVTVNLGRNMHYSNLNIDMSQNKTNFFENNQSFRPGQRAQVVMNNFHAPMNHYLALPNFNVVNSPRGLFSPNRTKLGFDTGPHEQSTGQKCAEHQSKAQLVCLTDRKIICTNCALFGVHKGHDYLKFEEFIEDCRAKMAPVLTVSKNKDLSKYFSEQKTRFSQFEARIKEKKEQMFKEISRVSGAIQESLRKQEQEARDQVKKRFEKFDARAKELGQLSADSRCRIESVNSTLDKIKMTLSSDIPDVEFLLENLDPNGQFGSLAKADALVARLDQKQAQIMSDVHKHMGALHVRPNQALLAELRKCFVRVSTGESKALRRVNTKKSSRKGSAKVLQSIDECKRMNKQSSLNPPARLARKSVNFSLEKEFEDFQFNLELNKRLNKPNAQFPKHVPKTRPQQIQIYTDSHLSDESRHTVNAEDFDPVNMMGPGDESAMEPVSDELLSPSPEKPSQLSRADNGYPDLRIDIRKSHTINEHPNQKRSMRFLEEMKNKTRNFELMIKNTQRKKLKRSAKQHKSQKHFNPKLKELINFSENLIFEHDKLGSARKSRHQKTASLRGSGMLAGYLSDRKLQDHTLISQFNEFAQARNLELSRKASAVELPKHKFSR